MKKILFVYPHNFLERNMGTNLRVNEIARKMKQQGADIDLLAFSNFCSSFEDFDVRNQEGLISTLFLYDFKKIRDYEKSHTEDKKSFVRRVKSVIRPQNTQFEDEVKTCKLDNWVVPDLMTTFEDIISNTHYDCIVMFYVYTADLLLSEVLHPDVRKVYFMEDFLSVGHFVTGKCKDFGGMLNEEMARVSLFDTVFCISWDEKLFFEKLLPNVSFSFLPHLIASKSKSEIVAQPTNLLFIGHNNEYNVAGIHWFFKHVYELIDADVCVKIVGKVSEAITESYRNVECISYVESLEELYQDTDIVICPLQNGTGMKIKVIEAMSYGIPVVCTSRGVDGFPDKTHCGCVIADNAAEFAQSINKLVRDSAFFDAVSGQTKYYFEKKLDSSIYENQLRCLSF